MAPESVSEKVAGVIDGVVADAEREGILDDLAGDADGPIALRHGMDARGLLSAAEGDAILRRLEDRLFPPAGPWERLDLAWQDLRHALRGFEPAPAAVAPGYLSAAGADGEPWGLRGCRVLHGECQPVRFLATRTNPDAGLFEVGPGDEWLLSYRPEEDGWVFGFAAVGDQPPRLVYPGTSADAPFVRRGAVARLGWEVDPVAETRFEFICADWPFAEMPTDLLCPSASGGWESDGEAELVERLSTVPVRERVAVCFRLAGSDLGRMP